MARGTPRSRSDADEQVSQRARTPIGCADAGHEERGPREHLQVDVVVPDLSMPDLDSLEVAQRSHASDPTQATFAFAAGGLLSRRE